MRAVERRRWPLAVGLLVLAALMLRLWGIGHGLPYVYNIDEGAHFVPRAIGMFGHSLNPEYFLNPPGYTYLLHVAFWVRWGGREAVGGAFAADPGGAFALARVLTAALGAAAVGLLIWAGVRLFDPRVALVAGALLAVAFLPVHYGHFALNDVPALAPLCVSLVGAAGVYRHGRARDYALAGLALGVAAATKYTAGIVILCLLAAAALGPAAGRGRGLALAGVLAVVGFAAANPYGLLDPQSFWDGLGKQSEASSDAAGKLGLDGGGGLLYYLGTLTWGLGWAPALAAVAGAAGLAVRDPRLALVLVPAPLAFLLFMGLQERYFSRWLLPIYPLLCLLAAWAVVAVAARLSPSAWAAAAAGALLCAQGLVFSIHNDVVLSRADTRALARAWMVDNLPAGTRVVIEPIAPAQWTIGVGTPPGPTDTGSPWERWRVGPFRGAPLKAEDYERTLRPRLLERYARAGFCHVVSGSTQYGRAFKDPEQVPGAIAYYRALERRSERVFRATPRGGGEPAGEFSFDFSFNGYPLGYERLGPEIVIRRLRGGRC